jgi:hypothetical protein
MNNEGLLKTMNGIEYTFIKVSSLDMSDMPSYRIIVGKDGLHVPVSNFAVNERKELEDLPVFDVSEYLKPTTIIIKRVARKIVRKKANKSRSRTKSKSKSRSRSRSKTPKNSPNIEEIEQVKKPQKIVIKRKPRLVLKAA